VPYDEKLDERISDIVEPWGTERKKMFGGTGHLLNGNVLAGVHKDKLVVRIGAVAGAAALKEPFVRPFDFSGRPMAGWIMVEPAGVEGDRLVRWLNLAKDHVAALPPK
jgi:TfoX/Sxy family transcriptional regulator of competence genes